jgi:hypothetical protein
MPRTFEKNGFHYTVKHLIDEDPDLSTLEPDSGRYEGCTSEEVKLNEQMDADRLAAFYRGEWHYIGIVVSIRKQTASHWADGGLEVGRASIWGIESDADPSHLDEIERAEIAEAEAEVARLRAALAEGTAA